MRLDRSTDKLIDRQIDRQDKFIDRQIDRQTEIVRWVDRNITHIHTFIHAYIHTHIHTYIHIHIHTYTYTHIHIHTYTHTHIHTYIHTYAYDCMGVYQILVNVRLIWLIQDGTRRSICGPCKALDGVPSWIAVYASRYAMYTYIYIFIYKYKYICVCTCPVCIDTYIINYKYYKVCIQCVYIYIFMHVFTSMRLHISAYLYSEVLGYGLQTGELHIALIPTWLWFDWQKISAGYIMLHS